MPTTYTPIPTFPLRGKGLLYTLAKGCAKVSFSEEFIDTLVSYWGLRRARLPKAMRNMTLLPAAWGEKKLVTSSSKKVSPLAPTRWAYAPR